MSRDSDPSVSIVIPARNEARNLKILLPTVPDVHEVIVVDGHSVDDTVDVVHGVRSDARVIQQDRIGKGNAMACGFRAASGDVIVMLDADGSADPAEIPLFVETLRNGADLAKGSRFHRGGSGRCGSEDITRLRKLGNAGLNAVANAMFSTAFTDLCYGYNAFWRDILPVLGLPPSGPGRARPRAGSSIPRMLWGDGFEIETLINCRSAAAGLKIVEVPSVERRRIHGETNLRTFADGLRVLRTLVVERRRGAVANPRPATALPEQRSARTALLDDPTTAGQGRRHPRPSLGTSPEGSLR